MESSRAITASNDISTRTFENEQFGEIRTVLIENEPWFVAADVCKALDIGNSSAALNRLESDERMTINSNESHSGQRGGARQFNLVNEAGLYSLVLGSRKPEAKAFKRWITHDVIPAIRKHGAYAAQPKTTAEMFAMSAQVLLELETRMNGVEQTLTKTVDLLKDYNPETWQQSICADVKSICKHHNLFYQTAWTELYDNLESEISVDISVRQKRKIERIRKQGGTKTEMAKVTKLAIVAEDKKLRLAFEHVLRHWKAKYMAVVPPYKQDAIANGGM